MNKIPPERYRAACSDLMVDVDGACPGSLLDVDDEVEKMAFISPGGPLDHRILLPKKGIRSGISGSKVVWVHFLSTSFEDAEGSRGLGPDLHWKWAGTRPLRPTLLGRS